MKKVLFVNENMLVGSMCLISFYSKWSLKSTQTMCFLNYSSIGNFSLCTIKYQARVSAV